MIWKIILISFGLVVCASVIRAKVSIDYSYYCRPELSCFGRSHVMCSYPKSWSSSCSGQKFEPMTNARKQFLIDSHNERRNKVALGQLGGVFQGRTAARMAEMVWDDELEMIAQKNLLLCQMKHDGCRRTKQYAAAGQNLAYAFSRSVEQFLQLSIDMFWEEYINITSINDRNTYASISARNQYGHFTQMARDQSFAMGCGVISTNNGNRYHIACNYAITNMVSDPVYDVGPVRSRCQTKSNKYPGLCGIYEDYFGTQSFYSSFKRDNSEVPPLKQWYANGHMLDVSNTPPYDESGEMVVTRQSMSKPARSSSMPSNSADRRDHYKPSSSSRPSSSSKPNSSSRPNSSMPRQDHHRPTSSRPSDGRNHHRPPRPNPIPHVQRPSQPSQSSSTTSFTVPVPMVQPNNGNSGNYGNYGNSGNFGNGGSNSFLDRVMSGIRERTSETPITGVYTLNYGAIRRDIESYVRNRRNPNGKMLRSGDTTESNHPEFAKYLPEWAKKQLGL